MASRSESILAAFHAALRAAAGDDLPEASRNETLAQLLETLPAQDSAGAALNLVDGSIVVRQVTLGPNPTYELALVAELEWLVQHPEQAERDAAFDAGMIAIDDIARAIVAATEDDASVWHGLAVADCQITDIAKTNLAIDGTPQLKGATISVTFEFTSDRPF